jgi:hypothetical protein
MDMIDVMPAFGNISDEPHGKNAAVVVHEIDYNPVACNTDDKILISKSGAFINFDDIAYDTKKGVSDDVCHMKAVRKIENFFTLKTVQIIGAMKQTKQCKVDKTKKRIIVPRFGVFEVLNDKYGLARYGTKSCLKNGDPPNEFFTWAGSLRPNQKTILKYMMNNIYTKDRKDKGSAGCILNLEAGQGKSYLAAYLMSRFQRKTAIVIHSTSLIDQWKEVIRNCYGAGITVGEFYGKKKTDGDVVLIVINSVLTSEFVVTDGRGRAKTTTTFTPIEYFNQFGFIIYDEAHEYANKTSGKAFKIAQAPYMLGLSATPDENANKFDSLVWWGIGPVLTAETLTGYIPTDADFTGEVHRKMYYGKPEFTKLLKNETTDMVSVTATIGMICEDPSRTSIVLDCIEDALEKNLYTFVFADRRTYLDDLRIALIARKVMSSDSIEMMTNSADYVRIVGGTKNEALAEAEAKSKVIFTTYQYMGTGKSIGKMNGLVLATPRKSKMKQYIKRIFRLGSDASITRHIYDIVDMRVTIKNQWATRKRYYDSQRFTITESKHDMNVVNKKGFTKLAKKGCKKDIDVNPKSDGKKDIDVSPKSDGKKDIDVSPKYANIAARLRAKMNA